MVEHHSIPADLGLILDEQAAGEVLTSELVTNSLRHSASAHNGAKVLVAASHTPCWLRVEVTDAGAATLPTLHRVRNGAEQGRGLHLVDALASRWDTRRDGVGTVTWFEIES